MPWIPGKYFCSTRSFSMCTLPRKLLTELLRSKDIAAPFWAQMSWNSEYTFDENLDVFLTHFFHWSKSCQKKFEIPYWLIPAGTLRTLAPLTPASRTLVSCCHLRMEVKQRWVTRLSKSNSATRIKPQITRPPSGKSTSASITTRRLFKVGLQRGWGGYSWSQKPMCNLI